MKTSGVISFIRRLGTRPGLLAFAAALLVGAGSIEGGFPLLAAENARWDFLRTNLQVFPGTEKLFEPDDKLFWRLRPGLRKVKASEKLPGVEHVFRVSTTADGRRVTGKADAQAPTVLFVGDSCTFGIPVNDRDAFPSRVQADLSEKYGLNIRALNAGVPGYSAFQGRILLEQFEGRAPEVVVITFWLNGQSIWDHLSDAEHVESLAAEREGEFSRHRLTRLLRRATPGDRPRLSEEEFIGQLKRMLRWCRKKGAVPVLQVWPTQRQMSEAGEASRQDAIRHLGREQRVRVVDLVPPFRERRDPGLFVDSVHCGREGYGLVAETLAPVLAKILAQKAAAPAQP